MRTSPDNVTSSAQSVEPIELYVTKRNGTKEITDVDKILHVIASSAEGLHHVEPMRVATKTIKGLVSVQEATTRDLDMLAIKTAADYTFEEPEYDTLATRLLVRYIREDAQSLGVVTFADSVRLGYEEGLINQRLYDFTMANADDLEAMIDYDRDYVFRFLGLSTFLDRYLLKHRKSRFPIELPQHLFMRIACALSRTLEEVKPFYEILSLLDYLPSSPTLFNAGTAHEQLSSCFLLDSPKDDLGSIYDRYKQIAMLSKFSGGVGVAYHRIRSAGSHINGTNGYSNGIIPWIKTLDSSVAAVNQGGRRKGACCVYLENWHADIEKFLELRDNTGHEDRRAHNLHIAVWISDLFMKRLETKGSMWSLFDPKEVPELPDLFGKAFEEAYLKAEEAGLAKKQIPTEKLYKMMVRTLSETGNGWMTFKDRCNLTCNQTSDDLETEGERVSNNRVVHLSNLCTEIIEVSSDKETAVCNLGSINLSQHTYVDEEGVVQVDYEKIGRTVSVAVRHLDRVIDLNFYPTPETSRSNDRWRPIGLGMMGLHDVFFQMREPFDSPRSMEVSRRIAEEIYYHALKTSCQLAKEYGPHAAFQETRIAKGVFQFDFWKTKPHSMERWDALREEVRMHGLRNSLLCAIAPTATIASIAGCTECIEPQVSNLYKKETLTGEFILVNRYLIEDLKKLGLWNGQLRDFLLVSNGSVQGIEELSPELKALYRTVWEMKMKPLIDMAAERGAFIDQSQSLNLFAENPSIGPLSAMYHYAWKQGLKTTYYLRSRPATEIAKTTVSTASQRRIEGATEKRDSSCSLENPYYCESCQ